MIYLDNNATTPIAAEVITAMTDALEGVFGNPSSGHAAGTKARDVIEAGRSDVAALIGAANPNEIVFTASGTESDNWAIFGAARMRPEKRHIITTTVEHEAVRKPIESLERRGYRVSRVEVDIDGRLSVERLVSLIDDDTLLVSVMLANNETGILFPVELVGRAIKQHADVLFHVDAVNAAGKVPIDVREASIDLLALSAHKFQGPKGIGAMYIREGIGLPSFMLGGGQERGRRSGTEAVHQIAGMGAAAKLAADGSANVRVQNLRDRLERGILSSIPGSYLSGTGRSDERLPNTSSISFENINGEMIAARLDAAGVCVSTGSACHAQERKASSVLQAMGVPYSRAMGAIRFSLGRGNTLDDIDRVLEILPGIIEELRHISGN